MAKKSKTQRAKASARRQARKAEAEEQKDTLAENADKEEAPKSKGLFNRSAKSEEKASDKKNAPAKASSKSTEKKKHHLFKKDGFFANVRKEMSRVTWPTRTDVVRWSGVVLGALVFFGVFVFVLDNFIVTPLLLGISSLGA